jgi:phage-related minor tail protein
VADDIRLVLSVDDRDLIRARKEQEKFQFRLAQIEKEYRKGNITAARYNAELAKQAKELTRLGGSYAKANSEVRKYAYGLRQVTDDQLNLAQALAKSGKGMRRMEILAQQAGYQIGDFAVQVQSGTNVAVAFGQQASQLLGFFGPYGAIAGAGIAIGTGLIAPLLNAKKAAKEATEQIDKLRERIDDIKTERLQLISRYDPELEKAADKAAKTLEEIIILQEENRVLEEEYGDAKKRTIDYNTRQIQLLKDRYDEEIKAYQLEEGRLRREEKGLTKAQSMQKLEENRLASIELFYENREKLAQEIAEREAGVKKILDAQAQAAQKITDIYNNRSLAIENQISLIQTEINLRKNYTDEQYIQNRLEIAKADLLAEQAGLSVKQRTELTNMTAQLQDQRAELERINRLNEVRMSAEAFIASRDPRYAFTDETALMSMPVTVASNNKPPKTKTGGGGAKADPLADLRKQLALENRMLGQTEARQRIMQALGDTYKDTSQSTIEQLEKQINVINEVKRAEEDRLQIQQTVESAFEDGFMSMIDGSKSVTEAFKDMARQIIAELYRVMVVQRMVRAISGFLPFADGGVFSGGSQVKAFANGGIVGGPTYFPMSGGQTGLMGEAGPEAIMPLKRGKDGKLGVEAQGGGNITVNQTINVSTGVQQTVRTEIKSLMPQIAESAKAAVADAKRRGGSYGKAF